MTYAVYTPVVEARHNTVDGVPNHGGACHIICDKRLEGTNTTMHTPLSVHTKHRHVPHVLS